MTDAIFAHICEEISLGDTLSSICAGKSMPTRRSFQRYLLAGDMAAVAQRRRTYAQARASQMDAWADEILRVAKDGSNDEITEVKDGRQVTRVNHENINRSRLIVDTMKWTMSKLNPAQYGDVLAVEQTHHMGSDLHQLMTSIRSGSGPRPVLPIPPPQLPPSPMGSPTLSAPPPPLFATAPSSDGNPSPENVGVKEGDVLSTQQEKGTPSL
jgi:hypothetical protein